MPLSEVVYVTGNDHKAKYFSKMVGLDIPHQKIDVDEIQSLDLREVVIHKVKGAYAIAKRPVIVEDTSLIIHAMGQLPGTYIKWFLQEIDVKGLCTLADSFVNRGATAGAMIAYYDGTNLQVFKSEIMGTIASAPIGDSGFGWNVVFIPNGQQLTLGQMDESTFEHYYKKVKPFQQIRDMLDKIKP